MAIFKKFFMKRISTAPERLRLYGVFHVSNDKNVRLIKVDNSTAGVIDCTYQEYTEIGKIAGPVWPKDEFNYPHGVLSATVNIHLVDSAGNPVDTMDTGDAPIL